jgi:alginate O-acetyltransferase complex protein AlgI
MLFNSYEFIFLFLPVSAAVFFLLGHRFGIRPAISWLVLCSMFFYGWWNPIYVPLILASMAFNFVMGRQLATLAGGPPGARKAWLLAGVGGNLLLLGYFKYANFFIVNLGAVTGTAWSIEPVLLPLGISFFTFTQIAFLVDAARGEAREFNPVNYLLFITFFPHLIAGPILHHKEMMPQFADQRNARFSLDNLAIGLTIFAIGLFKKAVIADSLSPYVAPMFEDADAGNAPDFVAAWLGLVAYTCQIYFDFSGYSDMAIGASRVFGIKLPVNFNSPYRATSISEFWRRWHMTLSRFLRNYIYYPLGGNRRGKLHRSINVFLTMAIGGIWHGAGWGFFIWGALHGLFMVIEQAWKELRAALGWQRSFGRAGVCGAWFLTFALVVFSRAFFRAETIGGAWLIVEGTVGLHGFGVPNGVLVRFGDAGVWLKAHGVIATHGGGRAMVMSIALIAVSMAIALLAPNTQTIMRAVEPVLMDKRTEAREAAAHWLLAWRPSMAWALTTGAMIAAGVLALPQVTDFLYFQF